MDIWATFANTKDVPGELQLVTAWDEYSIDANPEGYADDVQKGLASLGDQLLRYVEVKVHIDAPDVYRILDALNPAVTVEPDISIATAQAGGTR